MGYQSIFLKDILKGLSTPKNDGEVQDRTHIINDENQLINFLSNETIENFSLTYAEQILLCEGSQLGKADCTIPPYVEYENIVEEDIIIKSNFIRSELIEWALNTNVSNILFKSGALTIVGADFITNGDATSRSYRTTNSNKLFDNNEVFSLNLSSRDINIDLQFERCNFYSGINVSNSYCENLIFRTCRFGCAKDSSTNTNYSILSRNAILKGEFVIGEHEEPLSEKIESKTIDKWEIINSNVDFSFAKVEGQFRVDGYEQSSTIHDYGNQERKVKNRMIRLNSVIIKGSLILYNFIGCNISINFCTINGDLILSLAKFDYLFASCCDVNSVSAVSIDCNSVRLDNGSFVREGAMFYKSNIKGDLDCSGSYFGYSKEENSFGISISVGSSSIRSIYFSDGFIANGKIYMDHAKIYNSVNFRNSYLIGFEDRQTKKITSIYANHLNVISNITFNKNPASEHQKINPFYYREINILLNNLDLDYTDSCDVHKLMNDLEESDTYLESAFYKCNRINTEYFSEIKGSYTKVFGEANFEHSIVDGKVDCAGAVFSNYTKDNKFEINLHNALNLRFAEIKGSLFINSGLENYQLPFIAKGDVDLQNANLNNFFITVPSKKERNKTIRLRVIGTKYNYISDDSKKGMISQKGKKIFKRRNNSFYKATWIYYTGRYGYDYFKTRENNFRQPFEQFSSVLFKSGEDNKARDVLIFYRPSLNVLEFIFFNLIIKPIYFFGSRVYLCFISLLTFFYIGVCLFPIMKKYIAPEEFTPWQFSIQRLFPLVDIIDKDKYHLVSSTPWYWFLYYYFHTIIGTILLAMLLVNVARMRKGEN